MPCSHTTTRFLHVPCALLACAAVSACSNVISDDNGSSRVSSLSGRLPAPSDDVSFFQYCQSPKLWQNPADFPATVKTLETIRTELDKSSSIKSFEEARAAGERINWCSNIMDVTVGRHLDLNGKAAEFDFRLLARTNLRSLDISNSQLTDEHLAELRRDNVNPHTLLSLDVSHNRLTTLKPLTAMYGFSNLRRLDASHNALTKLEALRQDSSGRVYLEEAEELNLSNNPDLLKDAPCIMSGENDPYAYLKAPWASLDLSHTGVRCLGFLIRNTNLANNLSVLKVDGLSFLGDAGIGGDVNPLINHALVYLSARSSRNLPLMHFGTKPNPRDNGVDATPCRTANGSQVENCFPSLSVIDLTDATDITLPPEALGNAESTEMLRDRKVVWNGGGATGVYPSLTELLATNPLQASCSNDIDVEYDSANRELVSVNCRGELTFMGEVLGSGIKSGFKDSLIFQK